MLCPKSIAYQVYRRPNPNLARSYYVELLLRRLRHCVVLFDENLMENLGEQKDSESAIWKMLEQREHI